MATTPLPAPSDARILAFLLCDSAIQDKRSSKWTLVGLFNVLHAKRFPAVHPRLTFFLKLAFASPPGPFGFDVALVRLGSQPGLAESEVGRIVVRAEPTEPSTNFETAVEVPGLAFPALGDYEFRLSVGSAAATHPVTVAPDMGEAS